MRRLTLAPLPAWGDLFAALLNPPLSDDALAAPWRRTGEEAFWFSRSACSLAVVARWRQRLAQRQDVTVWIPDFFCNAALAPLRSMGAQLVFYPVTNQMAPDLDACKDLASEKSPDVFILVHYFGQPIPVTSVAAFCEEQGAWLVEDAAHVLRPIPGVGEAGDCVLYSPHKHLPIPDGAVLVVRPDGPARLAKQDPASNALREIFGAVLDSPGFSNQSALLWLFKRMLQRLGLRLRQPVAAFRAEAESPVPEIAHPRMSSLARCLLSRLKDSLDAVARLREQHARDWGNVLSWANSAMTAVSPLPAAATPYLAGFTCVDSVQAEAVFLQWHQAGLPVTTWPDLPPEVMSRADVHRSAVALRHSRFYLPVHQNLSQCQIAARSRGLSIDASAQWQVRALSLDQWEEHWQHCPKANLLQSWQYGTAKEETEGWKARRFLISDEAGQPVALTQLLTRGLPILGGIARLNRGPLLLTNLSEDASMSVSLTALGALLREARRQRWWMVQVAPELPDTHAVCVGLQSLGFRKLPGVAWASGRLALGVDEQTLLMGLKGKWRNCLRKGEKLGVTVTDHECNGEELDLLISSYSSLQQSKGFDGLSERLLRGMARPRGANWQFRLFIARGAGVVPAEEPLGVLVAIRHGDTATYLIGSTNEQGRQMQANSVLLWQAILHAKRSGCAWFDIGGLSAATPKGVAEFKQGLNAVPYELVGEWRAYLFPWKLNRWVLQNWTLN